MREQQSRRGREWVGGEMPDRGRCQGGFAYAKVIWGVFH